MDYSHSDIDNLSDHNHQNRNSHVCFETNLNASGERFGQTYQLQHNRNLWDATSGSSSDDEAESEKENWRRNYEAKSQMLVPRYITDCQMALGHNKVRQLKNKPPHIKIMMLQNGIKRSSQRSLHRSESSQDSNLTCSTSLPSPRSPITPLTPFLQPEATYMETPYLEDSFHIMTDKDIPDSPTTQTDILSLGKFHPTHVGLLQSESLRQQMDRSRERANVSLVKILSSLYAKLLVVMGVAFPLSEVISDIPPLFYEGFYLYLYLHSIIFLVYVYAFLLRESSTSSIMIKLFRKKDQSEIKEKDTQSTITWRRKAIEADVHCGSFYLRMGAVAFGIGSMIYSCLEFGMFFELDPKSKCYDLLHAFTPVTHMVFTFIQLYFIFMNSKMCIHKYQILARFGLMHMVATNLCVWLHVLVEETKHEITHYLKDHPEEIHAPAVYYAGLERNALNLSDLNTTVSSEVVKFHHRRAIRAIEVHHNNNLTCRRGDIVGTAVGDASPFLYPCTIEYSLICAAILYIMWKNIGRRSGNSEDLENGSIISSKKHRYSVDCDGAQKGLFLGIFVLVMTIISLILFFVLINNPGYKRLAVYLANIVELALYSVMLVAIVIAFIQMRDMKHTPNKDAELDDILLIVSQIGGYLFSIFSIIGGHHTLDPNTLFVLLISLIKVCQATLQTMFILDASRRSSYKPEHFRNKPGREIVTFLLVCNFAMWAVNCLETQRSDSNPVQLNFYGFWAWTIISNISVPMTIFYRFHCTVCLSEIWKKAYKTKSEQSLSYVSES